METADETPDTGAGRTASNAQEYGQLVGTDLVTGDGVCFVVVDIFPNGSGCNGKGALASEEDGERLQECTFWNYVYNVPGKPGEVYEEDGIYYFWFDMDEAIRDGAVEIWGDEALGIDFDFDDNGEFVTVAKQKVYRREQNGEGEPIKLGQVKYAAHGNKCFAVIAAAVKGDKILAAYIDEYQWFAEGDVVPVPCSDSGFGENYPEGKVLGSKRVNSEYYSNSMATKAGSTVALSDNYAAIEAFAAGKTIAELEAFLEGKDNAAVVDAVSGCTLVDTAGYLRGIVEAAKSAK